MEKRKTWFWRRKLTFSRDIFQVRGNFLFFHTVEYLHSDWFFEFSEMLYLIHEITTIDKFHNKVQSVLKKNSKIVTENPKISTLCTMLQKLSKCEVKAVLCCSLMILLSLRFYVKSNLGEFKQSKHVIFGNVSGFELWFLVNLSNFQVPNLPIIQVQSF